jgi:iron-sulfur cluster assembly protein
MFQLTPAAAKEILDAAERSDAAGLALRVAARQAADGSIEYGMGFDAERENDLASEVGDLTVLVGSASAPLLAETILDFVEVETGRFDFVFVPVAVPVAAGRGPSPSASRAGCAGGACGNCH